MVLSNTTAKHYVFRSHDVFFLCNCAKYRRARQRSLVRYGQSWLLLQSLLDNHRSYPSKGAASHTAESHCAGDLATGAIAGKRVVSPPGFAPGARWSSIPPPANAAARQSAAPVLEPLP